VIVALSLAEACRGSRNSEAYGLWGGLRDVRNCGEDAVLHAGTEITAEVSGDVCVARESVPEIIDRRSGTKN